MFVALTTVWLEFILGAFILLVTLDAEARPIRRERGRFGMLGFVTTFVGVCSSAPTGTLLAPFVAASTPDRRVHVATMGALDDDRASRQVAAFGFIGFAIGRYVPLMVAMDPRPAQSATGSARWRCTKERTSG